MQEEWGWPEGLEVRDVVEDEPPVGHVDQRHEVRRTRQDTRAPVSHSAVTEISTMTRATIAGYNRRIRRPPERGKPDTAAPAAFPQQETGDEIPGDDEEHINAEKAPGQRPRRQVVRHDAENRQHSQAVQAGPIAPALARRFGHLDRAPTGSIAQPSATGSTLIKSDILRVILRRVIHSPSASRCLQRPQAGKNLTADDRSDLPAPVRPALPQTGRGRRGLHCPGPSRRPARRPPPTMSGRPQTRPAMGHPGSVILDVPGGDADPK